MKHFSYALAYAVIVFLIYLFVKFCRLAYVHIKAFVIRRKASKVADSDKKLDTVKKDG